MRNLRGEVPVGVVKRLVWALVIVGSAAAGPRVAWANAGCLDPKMDYRITYQTGSTAAQTIDSAKITDIVEIGSRRFLVVYLGGYANAGYIDLDSVRSIVPNIR